MDPSIPTRRPVLGSTFVVHCCVMVSDLIQYELSNAGTTFVYLQQNEGRFHDESPLPARSRSVRSVTQLMPVGPFALSAMSAQVGRFRV